MGVTVQLMVDAAVSGVMFTCNPVSGDPSMVAINASWGLGLAVVGGEVTPDDYLVSKVTGEVVREQLSAKAVEYVPRADGRGTESASRSPEPAREPACLDEPRSRSWSSSRAPGRSATSAPTRTSSGRSTATELPASLRPPVAPRHRRRQAAAAAQRRRRRRSRW